MFERIYGYSFETRFLSRLVTCFGRPSRVNTAPKIHSKNCLNQADSANLTRPWSHLSQSQTHSSCLPWVYFFFIKYWLNLKFRHSGGEWYGLKFDLHVIHFWKGSSNPNRGTLTRVHSTKYNGHNPQPMWESTHLTSLHPIQLIEVWSKLNAFQILRLYLSLAVGRKNKSIPFKNY